MALKYQAEIDEFQLNIACPHNVMAPTSEINAFRFAFDPITHELNFLPNVVFDKLRGVAFKYDPVNAPYVCCGRCGASYYTTLGNAIKKWNVLPKQIRQKLGYTHIAQGKLGKNDGLMHEPDKSGHFGFYEDAGADLTKKFQILSEL